MRTVWHMITPKSRTHSFMVYLHVSTCLFVHSFVSQISCTSSASQTSADTSRQCSFSYWFTRYPSLDLTRLLPSSSRPLRSPDRAQNSQHSRTVYAVALRCVGTRHSTQSQIGRMRVRSSSARLVVWRNPCISRAALHCASSSRFPPFTPTFI